MTERGKRLSEFGRSTVEYRLKCKKVSAAYVVETFCKDEMKKGTYEHEASNEHAITT